jgi:sugar/nucleoside kinase (ribokinase family)
MTSFLIVGPVTRDVIQKKNECFKATGGPVYYQAAVFSQMNIDTTIVVTLSKDDSYLLESFSSDVKIIPQYKEEGMEFKNVYPTNNPNQRIQKACIPKNSIKKDDLLDLDISTFDAILLSPLSPYDIPLETFQYLYSFQVPIYLGVQGYLRHLTGYKVFLKPWKDYIKFLPMVDMIFLDDSEAAVILGRNNFPLEKIAQKISSFGPNEVIITLGDRGSLIYDHRKDVYFEILAVPPQEIVDPTGLGDTYMASYIGRRHAGYNPEESGIFASKVTALKLEKRGAILKINNLKKK